jgi:hypothetical protein
MMARGVAESDPFEPRGTESSKGRHLYRLVYQLMAVRRFAATGMVVRVILTSNR